MFIYIYIHSISHVVAWYCHIFRVLPLLIAALHTAGDETRTTKVRQGSKDMDRRCMNSKKLPKLREITFGCPYCPYFLANPAAGEKAKGKISPGVELKKSPSKLLSATTIDHNSRSASPEMIWLWLMACAKAAKDPAICSS